MANNLRVGKSYGFQPYRAVEAVPASLRIDPEQPRDQQHHSQEEARAQEQKHMQRRFTAMRQLIDAVKVTDRITRVDFVRAEQEMIDQATAKIGDRLAIVLGTSNLTLDTSNDGFQLLVQQHLRPEHHPAAAVTPDNNPLPFFEPGLRCYESLFRELDCGLQSERSDVTDAIRRDGYYALMRDGFSLQFYQENGQLLFNLCLTVGVCEVDDSGRKAILYRRSDGSYALYADKKISLSI